MFSGRLGLEKKHKTALKASVVKVMVAKKWKIAFFTDGATNERQLACAVWMDLCV